MNRSFKTQTTMRRSSGLSSFTQLTPTAEKGLRLGHGFLQLYIRRKAHVADILLLQLFEALGLGCFQPSVQLLPAVTGRGRPPGRDKIGKALALVGQLLSGAQLADDLFW